ncbi:hypothetical protein CIPAW_12G001200 [Carya illinoinensis]|uniref:Uncharacterized protein n=1 Tax=Carya illinoinensis TaxID=32201 RepID=A0A8T1NV17_CARIL|nr:hypothetical protein CIPAW_12G001200 [Carya illinoinensis]KAG6632774.1 hypothetical protein CIPAW_12G001200 [Carya illinoinensis]
MFFGELVLKFLRPLVRVAERNKMSEVEEQNEDFVDLDPLDSESFQKEEAKAKRRRRSNVWSFFEMVPDSEKKDGKP